MLNARPRARPRVCGVQALIRNGGEQGPPGGPCAASQRVVGLGVCRAHVHRFKNPLWLRHER